MTEKVDATQGLQPFSEDNLGRTLINFWHPTLGWALINFDNKFQDRRLFQRERLLESEV